MNVQGEIVKRLDILSNETLIHALSNSGQLCLGASEENEDVCSPPNITLLLASLELSDTKVYAP